VKQLYHERLQFPIIYESDDEIRFQPTAHFSITFKEVYEPVSPAHIAFEVPYSEFDSSVALIRKMGIPLIKWSDGREIDEFETGKNIYFRDGDGNLLEIISHHYIREDVLPHCGPLKVLYLREIGFPADDVSEFREWLKSILGLKTKEESDTFNFVIGGTAHTIVTSKKRRWIPIHMIALPPQMKVTFGVSEASFIQHVRSLVDEQDIIQETPEELYLMKNDYRIALVLTTFEKEVLPLLNLPLSRV
jgi:catechol 2,3-dioxygenase-like lactoylglutathione lyase family enzyme